MKVTKSELKQMIREALREELNSKKKLTESSASTGTLANELIDLFNNGDLSGITRLLTSTFQGTELHKFNDNIKALSNKLPKSVYSLVDTSTINRILLFNGKPGGRTAYDNVDSILRKYKMSEEDIDDYWEIFEYDPILDFVHDNSAIYVRVNVSAAGLRDWMIDVYDLT